MHRPLPYEFWAGPTMRRKCCFDYSNNELGSHISSSRVSRYKNSRIYYPDSPHALHLLFLGLSAVPWIKYYKPHLYKWVLWGLHTSPIRDAVRIAKSGLLVPATTPLDHIKSAFREETWMGNEFSPHDTWIERSALKEASSVFSVSQPRTLSSPPAWGTVSVISIPPPAICTAVRSLFKAGEEASLPQRPPFSSFCANAGRWHLWRGWALCC